jgi:hypothetical protein
MSNAKLNVFNIPEPNISTKRIPAPWQNILGRGCLNTPGE